MNHTAIYNTHSSVVYIEDTDTGVIAKDVSGNVVTLDQVLVDAELAKINAEQAATAYQRQRAPEYPPAADLADGLYWASKGDTTKLTEYYEACEAIKTKYPKGGAS